jgi:hypothetical protein
MSQHRAQFRSASACVAASTEIVARSGAWNVNSVALFVIGPRPMFQIPFLLLIKSVTARDDEHRDRSRAASAPLARLSAAGDLRRACLAALPKSKEGLGRRRRISMLNGYGCSGESVGSTRLQTSSSIQATECNELAAIRYLRLRIC